MTRSSRVVFVFVALSGLVVASVAGCADTDPKYGPPQVIKGHEIDFGLDAGAAAPLVEAGPTTKSATELFAALFDTLTDPTKMKGSTCLPCHAKTQPPMFMGATAEETRAKFKANNFTSVMSRFYLKELHSGGAAIPIKVNQKEIFQQWIVAEDAGAVTPPVDAGGG